MKLLVQPCVGSHYLIHLELIQCDNGKEFKGALLIFSLWLWNSNHLWTSHDIRKLPGLIELANGVTPKKRLGA